MFAKLKSFVCPICKTDLGAYNSATMFIVVCPDEDCKVKWCFKPGSKKPIAISYPGMKEPKKCKCSSCTKEA